MSELYPFVAITPRTFPCEGQRVAERPCAQFAIVRVGVHPLCADHARDELACAFQEALARLAVIASESLKERPRWPTGSDPTPAELPAAEKRYRQLLLRHLSYVEPPLTANEQREFDAYESGAIARMPGAIARMIGGDRR